MSPPSACPQSWDPERYACHGRFVTDLGMPVVELLAPKPGERVLDLGCGDGVLTERLVALGCQVVGVDGSPAQVEAARRRGLDGEGANPWYFRAPEAYRNPLQAQGFTITYMTLFPRPTPLPGDIAGWLETFAESFIVRVPVEERAAYIAEVREKLRPSLCDAEGRWTADYVRLRFAATKPPA